MENYELPLFPLNTVLFPGQTLPLHIFEPRYRQMIADCLQADRTFGVVLIRDGEDLLTELQVNPPVGNSQKDALKLFLPVNRSICFDFYPVSFKFFYFLF